REYSIFSQTFVHSTMRQVTVAAGQSNRNTLPTFLLQSRAVAFSTEFFEMEWTRTQRTILDLAGAVENMNVHIFNSGKSIGIDMLIGLANEILSKRCRRLIFHTSPPLSFQEARNLFQDIITSGAIVYLEVSIPDTGEERIEDPQHYYHGPNVDCYKFKTFPNSARIYHVNSIDSDNNKLPLYYHV
ncbi:hypothetical protein PFISCL1PPCAC_28950, partial [Pristionchus fissidentatus]